ncbi:restriction endonuclease subunit S [Bacteroides caecicola]|uniref:restriction endonuclease subunit S n=1 Tax=Bacteroides caecicola TaxID=1462569 RepID=UPI002012F487|nr:restriction endonuclease subunit S [Bacteroides caecicola]MCL1625816.1 restriction endonuclease subunit S [Bacteroides caecicola]
MCDVPALRFPEFSGEWKEERLDEIAELSKGVGISKEQLSEDGEPCILYGELYTKYKSEIIRKVISKTNIESSNLKRSKRNDVIIPCSGETAIDIAVARCIPFDNILLGGDLNIIRLHKDDGAFMAYQLNGKRKIDIAKLAQGVSVVHLYGENLKSIKTYNPCLQEQQKIVKLLSMFDERIEAQNKIIEKYESLIQAICDNLIEREIQQVTLSFSDFGQSYSGLSGKNAEDFGEGYPFITYMNVYQNQIIDSTDVGLVKINETEQQSVVHYGDILLTLSSETPEEVGMGAVYLGETYPLYLNSFCFGIHITDEAKIYPPFLAYYVSSQSFRKAVYPLAQGSTRFNLQKSDFMKKHFSFPMIEKQRKIYSILKAYSDKLIIEKLIMRLLCKQKCYLLRQLFI